jgi:hypothetical protein
VQFPPDGESMLASPIVFQGIFFHRAYPPNPPRELHLDTR